MNFSTQTKASDTRLPIEPYEYQLIEKKFSFLLQSLPDESVRGHTIMKIHECLRQGVPEERICGMFTGHQLPLCHGVSFASGKGGVGKSMLAINTAVHLSRSGKKVLLFDADYGLSNAHIYLGFRASKSLLDYFLSGDPDDAIEEISPELHYIHTGSGELKLADMDEHEFTRIRKMVVAVAGRYDMIIMDCSPGIGRDVVQTLLLGQRTVLVTTPQVSAITDTYALIKVLSQATANPSVSLVVNMARSAAEADEAYRRIFLCAKKFLGLDVEYMGNILYSTRVSESLNKRVPAVNAHMDDARSGARIAHIAQSVLQNVLSGQKEGQSKQGGQG